MGRGKTLSIEERTKISTLKSEGYSNRKIAGMIDRSTWVVNNYLRDPENYGTNRKGRTKLATTPRERRLILREASNSASTARQIASRVGTSVSIRTVRRIIAKATHLQRKKLKKKPPLTNQNRVTRLEFARIHMTWNHEWKNVVFSDEKKFNLDGPDGFAYYFHDLRKNEKLLSRRHSSVGSVMIWGAVSVHGTVNLEILSGRQTAENYKQMLQCKFSEINKLFNGQTWIFQQDNASIHTARVVQSWFDKNKIDVLQWPAHSPDLNIIENIWGWLSKQIYADGMQYNDRKSLISSIKSAWSKLPQKYIMSLYESIPQRIYEVILNKGGYTHY